MELNAKEEKFWIKHQFSANPPSMRGITQDEEQELDTLLQAGFSHWTWTDFNNFVRAGRVGDAVLCTMIVRVFCWTKHS